MSGSPARNFLSPGKPNGCSARHVRSGLVRPMLQGFANAVPDDLLVSVLYRLPRVNDLHFAHLALAVADEHIALVYSTTYPLS